VWHAPSGPRFRCWFVLEPTWPLPISRNRQRSGEAPSLPSGAVRTLRGGEFAANSAANAAKRQPGGRCAWYGMPPAPASGSRALRPGSFIGPMQQTRDSPEFRLIFQVTLNHRLLSAEAGPACRRVPRPHHRRGGRHRPRWSTTPPRSLPSRSGGSDATIVRRVRELIARPRRDHCVFGGRSLWKIALRHKENQ